MPAPGELGDVAGPLAVRRGPTGQELACINQTHFQVNTADAMTEAVVSGMGIGALPVYAAVNGLKDGSLVRVLPRYSLFHLNVTPSTLAAVPGCKDPHLVEFLREHYAGDARRGRAQPGGERWVGELSGVVGGVLRDDRAPACRESWGG